MTAYDDANKIAAWAQEPVARFVASGVVSGSGNQLSPTDITTRAQMVQVLYNLMSR